MRQSITSSNEAARSGNETAGSVHRPTGRISGARVDGAPMALLHGAFPTRFPGSSGRCGGVVFVSAFALMLAANLAFADGINLSWDDCGASGATLKTFACDTNSGAPFTLI